eukprot:m.303755 g.303755  ORF g.303755 m.303755 type:complete len:274 (-) comp15894_c0_seq8:3218-4039(-)
MGQTLASGYGTAQEADASSAKAHTVPRSPNGFGSGCRMTSHTKTYQSLRSRKQEDAVRAVERTRQRVYRITSKSSPLADAMPSPHCTSCFEDFGMLQRKYNCALCGATMCRSGDCSFDFDLGALRQRLGFSDTEQNMRIRACVECNELIKQADVAQQLRTGEHKSLVLPVYREFLELEAQVHSKLAEIHLILIKIESGNTAPVLRDQVTSLATEGIAKAKQMASLGSKLVQQSSQTQHATLTLYKRRLGESVAMSTRDLMQQLLMCQRMGKST